MLLGFSYNRLSVGVSVSDLLQFAEDVVTTTSDECRRGDDNYLFANCRSSVNGFFDGGHGVSFVSRVLTITHVFYAR